MQGAFSATSSSYTGFYRSPCDSNGNPMGDCIPIRLWALNHFLSVKQCRRLLKRGELCAVSFKGRLYVYQKS